MEEASELLCAKFEEKTGNEWESDDEEDRYVVNKGELQKIATEYLSRRHVCTAALNSGSLVWAVYAET